MKGLVADAKIQGQVEYLVRRMQMEAWADFWHALGLAESLPVFTIADMNEFRTNNSYVERVVEALYDYLLRIDEIRGAVLPPLRSGLARAPLAWSRIIGSLCLPARDPALRTTSSWLFL